MKIIDAHQHLWDIDRFRFSWCKDIPLLNHSFTMPDYLEAIQGLGIEKSVHLEADVDEPYMLDETRYILKLAAAPDNSLTGVVACARPERAGFRAYLDQIAGNPALKGVRRVLHTQPDAISQSATFVENIQLLPSYGLSFDLCVLARQLPLAIDLARKCPEVTFILDHCGVPQVKERALDPWRAHMREISRLPNVNCKVSGVVAYADHAKWTPEDLRPFVEHTLECFGWDRVMFGSDWPVCTQAATLKQWVDALLSLMQTASETDRAKLFCHNAARIYRLG